MDGPTVKAVPTTVSKYIQIHSAKAAIEVPVVINNARESFALLTASWLNESL